MFLLLLDIDLIEYVFYKVEGLYLEIEIFYLTKTSPLIYYLVHRRH